MNPPRLKKSSASLIAQSLHGDAARGAVGADPKSLALLLIHEEAEEIKQTTICMRQVYPGCRVEAVYTAEEALEWGPRHDWNVILLDEQLAHRNALELVPELRRQAPSSVIIVQAEHHDAKTAAKALRAGADLFLYKKSPAFLTELPIVTRGVLEQRALQKELAAERDRHSSLIEHFPGLLYELDADGRFVAIGAGVTALLGYSHQDLIGTHYSTLLHPDEWQLARHHLHERRTGVRARHAKSVRLIGRNGGVMKVVCQTSGLYGQHRQFLGTIGTLMLPGDEPSTASAKPGPVEHPSYGVPPPTAAPTVKESRGVYPERRREPRVAARMEASLHLRDAAYPGYVLDLSHVNVYVVVKGAPAVTRDQQVRLDFSLNGAVLELQGKIAEIRRSTPLPGESREQPGLGLVILYSGLGTIEGPILSSLLEELRAQPDCARLTIFPSLSLPADPS